MVLLKDDYIWNKFINSDLSSLKYIYISRLLGKANQDANINLMLDNMFNINKTLVSLELVDLCGCYVEPGTLMSLKNITFNHDKRLRRENGYVHNNNNNMLIALIKVDIRETNLCNNNVSTRDITTPSKNSHSIEYIGGKKSDDRAHIMLELITNNFHILNTLL